MPSLTGRTRFTQPTGSNSDVISSGFLRPVVPDKHMKFGDPRLNLSRDISPEAVGGVIFGLFLNVDKYQLEVNSDVIYDVFIDPIGVKVHVKFGDSQSNHS